MRTSKADRRRALAVRAFPPRWRERHGAEFLHVSGQLAASSDHHADWRELFDTVRGGLSVRIEDRPPFWVRAAYYWFEKPVPAGWHDWMRDDLRGRFVGVRRNLRRVLPAELIVMAMIVGGGAFLRTFALRYGLATVAAAIVFGPVQARSTRQRLNAKVGYDIVAVGPLPPPPQLIATLAPAPRLPAPRMPYVRYAVPLAVWSLISGVALIAGAAISNAPNRSIGPVTFSPDPNSPLAAQQVALIGFGVLIAAIAVAGAVAFLARRRVLTLEPTTAHESLDTSARAIWFAVTVFGVSATLLGALGVAPDLACASLGAVLVITGAAHGAAASVVAPRDVELGRHLSLAELLVGERDPATTRQRRRPTGAPNR